MILEAFLWCLIKKQVLDYYGVTSDHFDEKMVENYS